MSNSAEGNGAFSPADFEPKASNWFSANVKYEGSGSADFTSPVGGVTGPFLATYDERGDRAIRGPF